MWISRALSSFKLHYRYRLEMMDLGSVVLRSWHLLPLASAASTHDLQQSILPDSVKALEDQSVETTEQRWLAMSGFAEPATEKQHIQTPALAKIIV